MNLEEVKEGGSGKKMSEVVSPKFSDSNEMPIQFKTNGREKKDSSDTLITNLDFKNSRTKKVLI